MPLRISLRNTDFFKEIQRYLTTMHGNQVPVIELSFIDNFSWKKLSLNLTREIAGLEQEEYMYENCRDNKYFLINLGTEARNNDSITKIWLCKVMSKNRGWQVTKSPPLNLTWVPEIQSQTDRNCHFGPFFAILPITTQNIKNLKKWKKHLEMSSIYTYVPKITIM